MITSHTTSQGRGLPLNRVCLCIATALAAALGVSANAQPASYKFTLLRTLSDPAAGGGNHINDFEPSALNNRGDVLVTTDLGTSADPNSFFGEGVFLLKAGQETALARAGDTAPGGGTFDFLELGATGLNDAGDGVFSFTLSPFGFPVGVNSGTFRYSNQPRSVTPVVLGGATPAPGGGIFQGVFFNNSINNRGDIVFEGIINTQQGIHVPGEAYVGLGMGVYNATPQNRIIPVVVPGDAAPDGRTFDYASGGYNNDKGDVVFTAHLVGDDILPENWPAQAVEIGALTGAFLKNASSGTITAVARMGDLLPGGTMRAAYGPVINNRGDVAFVGDLSEPPHSGQVSGIYLRTGRNTVALAIPGTPMPGGGNFVTTSALGAAQLHLNQRGEVVFNALLDQNNNGIGDTGLYQWSNGSLSVVARSGTVIPGLGTIGGLISGVLTFPPANTVAPNSGAINNDNGKVLFSATLTDGTGVLLLATPTGANK